MKHCQPCSLEFPDGYRFCGVCGGPLSAALRCTGCGELTEGKWTFCTTCGKQLSSQSMSAPASPPEIPEPANLDPPPDPVRTPGTSPLRTVIMPSAEQPTVADRPRPETVIPQEWYLAPDLFDDTTTLTSAPIPRQDVVPKRMALTPQVTAPLQPEDPKSAPVLTMLSGYGEPEVPAQFRWWHGAILGLFMLLFVGVLGVGVWYWWAHRGSVAQTAPAADSNTPPATTNSASPSSKPASTIASGQMTASRSADEELRTLRERRSGAKSSDRSE